MGFPRYVVAVPRLLAAGRRSAEHRVLIAVTIVALFVVGGIWLSTSFATAAGCTDSWTSASTGSWDTPSSWSTGKVPISSDRVCISSSGNTPYNVIVGNETIDIASLTVGGAGSEPTLMIGNAGAGGTAEIDISDDVDIASTATVTVAAPTSYSASLTAGSVTNAGTFSVQASATLTLSAGSTFENTSAGTITVGAGDALDIVSPSGETAAVELDSGGAVDNSGSLTVSDTLDVEGGSICGNALHLGNGNGSGALAFATTPGTGAACEGGVTTDHITLLDATTLSGTIPASYTVAAGGSGVSYDVALSGDVINDGTFEVGVGGYEGKLSAADSSDYLTNNGTVTTWAGGTFNTSLVNNSAFKVEGEQNNVPIIASLQNGRSWQNTSAGTITVGAGDALDIVSPSGESASFTQDGVIDNAGIFNVGDPITINGGTICDDPVKLGSGDEHEGTFTLTFAANPSAGPACTSGQARDQLFIYNVAATIESGIPAGYTVAMGDDGPGYASVGTPGDLTNAGTLEPEWGTTLTINGSIGTLTSTGAIEIPATGYTSNIDASAVDNTTGHVEVGDSSALAISGTYSQGSQANFSPQIDGTSAGSTYGQLTATGGSTLAGTLDIDTVSGFSPTAGNTFEIIKGGAVSGTFATILGQYPAGDNSAYGVSYDASDVTLTASGQSTTTLTVSDTGDGSGTVSSAPAGIDCGSTCVAGFPQNQSVTLTETPASGSVFSGWSGACAGSSTCQVTLSTAQSVQAEFTAPPTTTTSLKSSTEPSTVSQQVTYTATVSPAPDGGTVSFTEGNSTISGCGSVAVNTSTGVATCSPTYSAVGSHAIQASYSGDTDFSGSQSSSQIQVVDAASTTTTLQSSANPSLVGQQVTYTASVSSVPDGGTIAFTDGRSTISGCGSVAVNTSTGEAICQATYASTGAHTIEASYSGNTDYAGSKTGPFEQIVNTAGTSTALKSSANPSLPEQQVTYTATVSPVPDGGTVAFTDGGSTISGCGSVAVNTSTGEASCQQTYPATGSHQIQALYSGNAHFASSESATLTQVVAANSTSTALQSSANPSLPGQQVTFTATVSPTPDGGTVNFTDGASPISGCESVPVNTSTGVASCQVTYTSGGSHSIEAEYSGDTLYGPSHGNLTQVVSSTSTALQSSANPSLPEQQVTYTATVSPVPDGGTVAFTDGGSTISGCGSVAVNTSTGEASCQQTYPATGSHQIQALYSGNAHFASSESATLTQTVNAPPVQATTMTVTASPNPYYTLFTAVDTFTATISPVPDGGNVAFTANGVPICYYAAVNSSGQATCTGLSLYDFGAKFGPLTIQATYAGDARFNGAQASTVLNYDGYPSKLLLSASPSPGSVGQPVTYSATVNAQLAVEGTVTLTENGKAIPGCSLTVNGFGGTSGCSVTYNSIATHTIVANFTSLAGNYDGDTSSTVTESVEAAAPTKTVQPAQATITTPPCPNGYTCGAIAAPLPVPPTVLFGCQLATVPGVPAVSARKEGWAANVDDPSATATRNSTPVAPILIPKVPVGPVLAAVIANDVQAAQTALESVPVSALRQAGPTEEPTVPVNPCGAVGGRAAAKPSSAPTSPSTKTYLGPPAASVLAAIYKTHPSRDDVSAFLDEVLLAESKTSSPARALARYVLTDAVKLGEATLAYQFHDKRLRQLKLSHVRIGSVHARGHGHLLTIKPNVLGARVLRLLEVLGLAHRVSIQLTLSERAHGHVHVIRRTIRVL